MFLLSIPAEPVSSSKQAERLDNYISRNCKRRTKKHWRGFMSRPILPYTDLPCPSVKMYRMQKTSCRMFSCRFGMRQNNIPLPANQWRGFYDHQESCSLYVSGQKNKMIPFSAEDLQEHLEEISQVTSDDRIVLEALLKSLQDTERQILVLHALSGMKHREIARFCKSTSDCSSKYHRAVKKLGKIMKEADIE